MKRNVEKMELYKEVIGKCCNPKCNKDHGLEVHHVIPLHYSGLDDIVNYIVLCRKCHMADHNHRDYDLRQEQLFKWKFYNEILVIGDTSDDYSDIDYRRLLRATRKAKRQAREHI